MADQASPGTVAPLPQQPGSAGGHLAQVNHGRPVSWTAVAIIWAGFLAGGTGLISGPTWWLFWAGLAAVVAGGLLGLVTHIMEDWY